MSMTKGTPASSQIITLERLLAEATARAEKAEAERDARDRAWEDAEIRADTARNRALEEAAEKAVSFLVGDPTNGVPLRNPMAHEIANAILALRTKEPK